MCFVAAKLIIYSVFNHEKCNFYHCGAHHTKKEVVTASYHYHLLIRQQTVCCHSHNQLLLVLATIADACRGDPDAASATSPAVRA